VSERLVAFQHEVGSVWPPDNAVSCGIVGALGSLYELHVPATGQADESREEREERCRYQRHPVAVYHRQREQCDGQDAPEHRG
jgi:hypothetical protein